MLPFVFSSAPFADRRHRPRGRLDSARLTGVPLILAIRPGERETLAAFVNAALEVEGGICARNVANGRELLLFVEDKLRDARTGGVSVRGVAVALPDSARWRGVRGEVSGFDLPCTVERSAAATWAGERLRDPAARVSDAVLLDADDLQLALHLNGRPYVGAHGLAGDIAHLGLDRTGGIRCACGRNGCLGALLEAGAQAPPPPAALGVGVAPSRSLGWLAVAGVALLNLLNPALLIVQGIAFDPVAFDWFAEAVREGCLRPTRAGLLAISRARSDSALVGAAACFAARHR